MAAGVLIKHKRKTSAFAGGELSAGELGVNTNNGVWYYSVDGSTVNTFASGIGRTVVVTSGSITLGNTASTDYVYFVAGPHTLSMPAAAGNTNRYTIKNNHSAAITVDTVGAENIEGAASLTLEPNDAIDVISDGTNWYVV